MLIAETQRLLVRHFVAADAGEMMSVFGDAEVMRFSMSGVRDETWVRGWIDRCTNEYETRGYGLWAVVEKSGRRVIGYCGLKHYPDIDGSEEVEIGYRLARANWGRGHATATATAVRDYAFDALGLRRLISLIDPVNVASIRVAEKIGMRHEKDVMLDGYAYPDWL